MTTSPFWTRLDETYAKVGVEATPREDRPAIDAHAERIQKVQQETEAWESPAFFAIPYGHKKFREVLRSSRLIGTEKTEYIAAQADWESRTETWLILPVFDPDNPEHLNAPRLIFAHSPHRVHVFRGPRLDTLANFLLSITVRRNWRCDWGFNKGYPQPHDVPFDDDSDGTAYRDASLPYLVTHASGDYVVVFTVCSMCLTKMANRGRKSCAWPNPNTEDLELIEGDWKPIWHNPRLDSDTLEVIGWDHNADQYRQCAVPAVQIREGILIVLPVLGSGWRDSTNYPVDVI